MLMVCVFPASTTVATANADELFVFGLTSAFDGFVKRANKNT